MPRGVNNRGLDALSVASLARHHSASITIPSRPDILPRTRLERHWICSCWTTASLPTTLHFHQHLQLMERKSSNLHLCCPHPSRSLSPTEPARPAIISLDGIFAVAALPEDHPHALKIPERRPGSKLAKTIIKSPSVVGKLKGQLKRKWTVRSLRAEVYDGDARRVGSEEVLERVERAEGRER